MFEFQIPIREALPEENLHFLSYTDRVESVGSMALLRLGDLGSPDLRPEWYYAEAQVDSFLGGWICYFEG